MLTAEAVETLAAECLFTDDEIAAVDGEVGPENLPAGAVLNTASGDQYAFHGGRVAERKEEIRALLRELPDGFQQERGGGTSFLNACDDRHGRQWTGLHRTMELLFALGAASGVAKCLMPREMWGMLPGGMPYFVVL